MQHAKDADAELCELLSIPGQARVDRVATIDIVAIDWNCPKYIPQWFSEQRVKQLLDSQVKPLQEENELLKAELARLKNA